MKRVLIPLCLTAALVGCSPSNTQSLQDHTADVTAAAKRDAGAIARGVAQGLTRKGPVNINSASDQDLERLPGVTPELAESIRLKRPYANTRDLVRRHVMTTEEYNRVKSQIVVQ